MILNLNPFKSIVLLLCLTFSVSVFSQTTIDSENFETGGFDFTFWNDGGSDCSLNTASILSGTNCANLRDNSGTASSMYTIDIDLTSYASVDITFDYEAVSMETGEDFFIEFSNDGGSSWNPTPIAQYISGTGFANDTTYTNETVSIINGGTYTFTAISRFRIRCDATRNNDNVYFDNILIEGYSTPSPEINITGLGNTIVDGDSAPEVSDDTDFGSVATASTLDHTFTIQNTGALTLNLEGTPLVDISGDLAFTIITQPSASSIASGGSDLTFVVRFAPTVGGAVQAIISIDNDDSNENPYIFTIQGTGTVPMSCSSSIISLPYFEDFESGSGNWNSGGSDANYVSNATWSYSGSSSLEIRNNSGLSSAFCSPLFSLNGLSKVDFKFFFSARAMDNDEEFTIEYSSDSGGSYTTVATFVCNDVASKDADFESTSSTIFYSKTVTLQSTDYTFPVGNTGRFRIMCNSSSTSDLIYIDDISIIGTVYSSLTYGPGGIINDLDLWLKADKLDGSTVGSDGSNVSEWIDNGKGNDAGTVVSGQEPVYRNSIARNFNFNPVIDFENDNNTASSDMTYLTTRDELKSTGGFNSDDVFIVLMPDPTITDTMWPLDTFQTTDPTGNTYTEDVTGFGYGGYTQRFENEYFTYCIGTSNAVGNGFGRADISGTINYNQISIINTRHNVTNTGVEIYLNANQVGTDTSDSGDFAAINNTRFWLGRSQYWNGSFDGRIAEVITYSSRKNDTDLTVERNRIQSYLGIKYGITLGVNGTSQDYVDSDGTVIWDQLANSGYNNDIAGIGRDDASELNQKQSKSVNETADGTGLLTGILTIGLTDLYDTNSDNIASNPTVLGDKEFLVWGNNGVDLTLSATTVNVNMSAGITPALTTDVTFTAMQRVWKFVESGVDVSKVKISIPQNAIRNITPPGSYLMFISDTGVFDPTADYRVMTSDGSGNLETTYDFDGIKFITFGYAPEVIFERSIYFDGAVDYVDMEDALDLNTSFTVSAWIKRGSGSANTSILSKRDAAYTEGYDFKINGTGQFEMSWKNGSTQTITSDVVIPEDIWHQVAIIYSGGTANLFIDGVLDKTAALTAPTNTTQSFYIAAAGKSSPTAYFEGNIDEVRVWDTALSVDQLRYVMNQEIIENTTFTDGVFVPTSITKNDVNTIPWTNLAGYYPMSVYTYTNTNDASGNNNQGALRNLNTVDYQTAPLPYKSNANGDWDTNATWLNGNEQTIPGATSIVDSNTTVDWNIVETSHNINIDNTSSLPSGKNDNRFLLALMVSSNELTLDGDNATGIGNGLTITHYLKLDGVLDLEGESQLIQTEGSDLAISSSGNIERDQQGTENSYTYNYWSAPVSLIGAGTNNSPFTIADILKDGTDPANPVTPNFAYNYEHADGSFSTPRKIATYWIWNFVNLGNAYANWNWIGDSNNLNVSEGYTMKGTSNTGALSDDQNYVFIGKPNNVLNGATELVHTPFTAPGDPSNPEISLTGNPFPSAIDANQFITDNLASTDGQILFWEHWGGGSHILRNYQGGYATKTIATGVPATSHPDINQSGTGSKTPGQYISVAQGFFVTSSAVGGNVVFKNSQRVFEKEGTATSVFFRGASTSNRNNEEEETKMIIRLGFESPNGFHRQVAAVFNIDGATDAIEKGYDGHASDILSNDAFFIQNDKYYVIQAYGDFNEAREIPLIIIIDDDNNGGLQKIMIDELENISESTEIYIKDNLVGETFDIKNQTFEINLSTGVYKDRFSLVFKSQSSLAVEEEELLKDNLVAYMNNTSSTIIIKNSSAATITKVTLFNAIGQAIQVWTKELSDNEINLPVHKINTGIYILKIDSDKINISKKLIIE